MKRRRSSAHLTDPQTIRKFSSGGVIDGVHSSHNRFDNTNCGETEDIQVLRRVKFRDPGPSKLPSSSSEICPVQNEGTQSQECELPKTSEYAFFKKVKKNARGHSYPQKNNNRSDDGEINDCAQEILNKAKQSYKDMRPPLPIKNPKPINQEPHFSPLEGVSKGHVATNMVDPTPKGIRPPPFIEKVKSKNHHLLSSPFSCGSKKEDLCMSNHLNLLGNQSSEGVFGKRRQRLQSWISNSLPPKFDDACYDRVDLVDVLLSRLFPENDENYCHLRQTKHSRPSSALDTDTRKSTGYEHGSDLDDRFFKYGTGRPKYAVAPELDTLESDYPSTFDKIYSKSLMKGSYPEIDSFHNSPYPRYRSITWNLEELDEFHGPNTPAPKEEPLLIGWDFKNEKEEQELCIMPKAMNLDLFSWGNYYIQEAHGNFHACFPSLFSNVYPSLDFPPNNDSRRYLPDENYHIVHSPKYLKMVEEDSTSDYELDFGLKDPLTKRFSPNHHEIFEGTLNPNNWPIINFQIPSDVEMGPVIRPLLLDNTDWTQSEQEIYGDEDNEDEWRFF